MFSGNGVASAIPFLRFAGRSAQRREVFTQGYRKCQSVVPCILLTCPAREHTSPLSCHLREQVLIREYPEAVRCLIYTTNTIEGFNRQLRKVTKSKTVFLSDDSLLKRLYLAMMDIMKNGRGHWQDRGQIQSCLTYTKTAL